MAEERPANTLEAVRNWVKAGVTSALGLVGGAVLMYLTPLINNVVKPAKPLANFATQVQGLSVTFNNRSVGGTQGWWDFGDGSALEPFSPKQDTVTHSFPRAGNYTVKLTLENLIGEQNERDITVNVDPGSAPRPTIDEFQVTAVTPESVAPAVFRVKSKIKNAELCIWSMGDNRPLEVSEDVSANQDRYITLKDPGYYTVRLVAVNGKQTIEQAKDIFVGVADHTAGGGATATLQVTYDAMEVERQSYTRNVHVPWTGDPHDAGCTFEITRTLDNAHRDFRIVSADVLNKQDPNLRNVQVEINSEKTQFVLRGEMTQQPGWAPLQQGPPPHWLATVALTVERHSAGRSVPMEEIPVPVHVPGATSIPIPPLSSGWLATARHMQLTLRDGTTVLWSGNQPPVNAILNTKTGPWRVNATEQGDHMVLQFDAIPGSRPLGN